MAVSKLKLINISGPMSKFDVTAREILRHECFHPENVRGVLSGFKRLAPFEDENPYKDILKKVLDLAEAAGITPEAVNEKFDEPLEEMSRKVDSMFSRLQEYDRKIRELQDKIEEDKIIVSQMDFMAGLNVDIRDLYGLKFFKYRFGKIQKNIYQSMGYFKFRHFEREVNPYAYVYKLMEDAAAEHGFKIKPAEAGVDESHERVRLKVEELSGEISKYKNIIDATERKIEEFNAVIEALNYIAGMPEDTLGKLKISADTEITFRYGSFDKKTYNDLEEKGELDGDTNFVFVKTNEDEKDVFGIYFTKNGLPDGADKKIESLGFKFIYSSSRSKKNPAEFRQEAEKRREAEEMSLSYAEKLCGDKLSELESYINRTIAAIDAHRRAAELKGKSGGVSRFSVSGWISEENNPFVFIETGRDGDYVFGVYIAPRHSIEYVDSLFASLQFERIRLNERALGTPSEVKDTVVAELKSLERSLEEALSDKKAFTDEMVKYINYVYTDAALLNKAAELKRISGHSQNNFYMSGWVAKEDLDRFLYALDSIGDIKYIVEDPSFLKTTVPTKMKNFFLFKPFETFVKMYGVPGYGEIDPTPLVAISYLLFFGLMFGDLGQGAIIALLGAGLWIYKKMPFGKILLGCGISSMIFGTVYDSVFGYEGVINTILFGTHEGGFGYHPGKNMMLTLLLAVSIGVVFILIAMVLNVINSLRQRNFEKGLFGHNGIAGIVVYASTIWLVVNMLLLGGSISKGFVIGCIVLPLVVIFFRAPLGSLVAGKKARLHGGIGEFIIESFFELFDDVLSFVTNTVSYVRIGAFALSHSGMMFVVFLLANTTATAAFGSGNLVVVIIGNIVIMGLEGLVVGIQALRLEFYEIFSRFYSGDGVEFSPARIDGLK